MTIKFILMVNKHGQTRLAQYYAHQTLEEKVAIEGEIIRKCLARSENQVRVLFLFLVPVAYVCVLREVLLINLFFQYIVMNVCLPAL